MQPIRHTPDAVPGAPPEQSDLALQRQFLLAIFGPQLTRGKQPNGAREQLSWCLLRLMDDTKSRCVWQEAYRRVDSVIAGVARLNAAAARGHAFFCPNGFAGNGRQRPGWRTPGAQGQARHRDGQFRFGEAQLASLLAVTVELDAGLVAPHIHELHNADPEAFWIGLDQQLRQIGAGAYLVVRTRPGYGYHVHLLLEPCAAADNLVRWKAVSRGLQQHFASWGADPAAAGSAVQLFRLPATARPDIPGWQTEWVQHRQGPRVPLDAMAAALVALGCLPEATPCPPSPAAHGGRLEPQKLGRGPSLLGLIDAGRVRGFAEGARNEGLFSLWRCLNTEGWPEDRIAAALARVNRLCTPGPLAEAELAKTVRSAQRYHMPVAPEVWERVCAALGVNLAHPGRRASRVRYIKAAPDRYQQQVRWAGEALDRFMMERRTWRGQMPDLLRAMEMPQGARSALYAAIRERVAAGTLQRTSRPGRYGYVQLTAAAAALSESVHCFNTGGAGGSRSAAEESKSAMTGGEERLVVVGSHLVGRAAPGGWRVAPAARKVEVAGLTAATALLGQLAAARWPELAHLVGRVAPAVGPDGWWVAPAPGESPRVAAAAVDRLVQAGLVPLWAGILDARARLAQVMPRAFGEPAAIERAALDLLVGMAARRSGQLARRVRRRLVATAGPRGGWSLHAAPDSAAHAPRVIRILERWGILGAWQESLRHATGRATTPAPGGLQQASILSG